MTAAADTGVERNASGVIRQRNRPARFLRDVVISICITFGILAVATALIDPSGIADGVILGYTGLHRLFPAAIYGVPLVVALYGLMRLRFGFVVGPAVLAVVSFATSVSLRQIDQAALEALGAPALAPPAQGYQMVAIEGGPIGCDQACVRFLAASSQAFASRRGRSGGWMTYTRGEGDVCLTDEHVADMLKFLVAGYRGMCVLQTYSEDITGALIYRARPVTREMPAADLPRSFRGATYEIAARSGGAERRLGRRVIGSLDSP